MEQLVYVKMEITTPEDRTCVDGNNYYVQAPQRGRSDSTSTSMQPMTRPSCRRQRQHSHPVVDEEVAIIQEIRNPRKLTERRKGMIRRFLAVFSANPQNFDEFGSSNCINSLLEHMQEKPQYGLIPADVKYWLEKEDFFRNYEVNGLEIQGYGPDQEEPELKMEVGAGDVEVDEQKAMFRELQDSSARMCDIVYDLRFNNTVSNIDLDSVYYHTQLVKTYLREVKETRQE